MQSRVHFMHFPSPNKQTNKTTTTPLSLSFLINPTHPNHDHHHQQQQLQHCEFLLIKAILLLVSHLFPLHRAEQEMVKAEYSDVAGVDGGSGGWNKKKEEYGQGMGRGCHEMRRMGQMWRWTETKKRTGSSSKRRRWLPVPANLVRQAN